MSGLRSRAGPLLGAIPLVWAAALPAASPLAAASDSTGTTVAYDVSGLRVIQRQIPAGDVVAARLYLLGGARQLSSASAGIEAMLLRTIELDVERSMARAGGRLTVSVDADWSVLGFVSLDQDFDSAWTVVTRPLVEQQLSPAAAARAKSELVSAAHRRVIQPDLRIRAIAQLVTFGEHPYGVDVWGTEQSLSRFTRLSLERYAADQFVTSRMLLVVVGPVSRQRVESLVVATLGRLPRGEYEWTLPPPVPRRSSEWLTEHRNLPTNYILGYFAGPSPKDDDYFAFQIATQLLSSGLAQVVRDRRSLSYAAYAPFLDRAIPIGGIYASTRQPSLVYRLMQEEIADLRADEVHPEGLRRFVSQFTLDELGKQMTSDGQADALGRAELYFGDYRVAGEYLRRLQSVRPSDVRRAARKYMQNLQLAYLGDTTRMEGKW